jgi:hypothetical protein
MRTIDAKPGNVYDNMKADFGLRQAPFTCVLVPIC